MIHHEAEAVSGYSLRKILRSLKTGEEGLELENLTDLD